MPDYQTLPVDLAETLEKQGGAEIVVGLPSFNNVGTITTVVEVLRRGLSQAFPDQRALIVNVDCSSTDGTAQQLMALPDIESARLVQTILPGQNLAMPYHGIPGKSDGLRLTLLAARQVGARACLMFSPDLTSAAPEWFGLLCRPVLEEGFDYVVPLYAHHKFDGSITNAIGRPLLRSLYGRHMRQPMGGEYVLSSALVEHYLGQRVWGTDLDRYGSDIWTTTQALSGSFKLGQVNVGEKVQVQAGTPTDLGTTLNQVLSSLFEDMARNASVWQRVRGAQPIPIFGAPAASVDSTVTFDLHRLTESFRLGLRNLQDLWGLVLAPATLLDLRRIAVAPDEAFTIPDTLWCRVVFDFALGYRIRTINRSHLLGSFLPLYLGWLASYVREMQTATNAESEQRLERLCQAYEAQKSYLISRWRSPDRFNP